MFALALPVLLASCGTSPVPSARMLESSKSVKSESALFVAKVADSSTYIVIINQDRNMAAYTYDNNAKTTTWFTGMLQDGNFFGTAKNGSSIIATLKDGIISGKLNAANRSSLNFTALPAQTLETDAWQAASKGLFAWLGSLDGMQTYKLHEDVTEETPDPTDPVPSDGTQELSRTQKKHICVLIAQYWVDIGSVASAPHYILRSTLLGLFYKGGCSEFGLHYQVDIWK